MKKVLQLGVILLFVAHQAQIKFEKGLITFKDGTQKELLIKNTDSRATPEVFEYKASNSDVSQTVNVNSVKAVEIYQQSKYISEIVDVDQSSDKIGNLSTTKEPEFKKMNVFLKVLSEGKYKLYEYSDAKFNHYFYSTDDSKVEALIYKPYEIGTNKIAYNEAYKMQLKEVLTCLGMKDNEFSNTNYSANSLNKIFTKANVCSDPSFAQNNISVKRGKLNINIRPRINLSSVYAKGDFIRQGLDMGTVTNLSGGIEFEYVAPFNKNKWAIVFEPNFQQYTANSEVKVDYIAEGKLLLDTQLKFIELPIGVRHYLFLNSDNKLFFNALLIPQITFDSEFTIKRVTGDLVQFAPIRNQIGFGFGLGYNYKNKFSVEGRYTLPRSNFGLYYGDSKYDVLTFAVGYNIF